MKATDGGIGLMVLRQSYDRLAVVLSERFGVAVDASRLAFAIDPHQHELRRLAWEWADDSWFSWLKLRLLEMGHMRDGRAGQPEVRLAVPLHVGFLTLEETPEMLEALAERGEAEPQEARSKVFKTGLKVHPINRVAHRVAPEPTPIPGDNAQ